MLTSEEIFHIAQLAKLEISEAEAEKYSRELSAVLSYVEQLDQADISSVNQETRTLDSENVLREDEVLVWDQEERELALQQGEICDGLVKVKKVL
jgi:aspartyl-tRNA(Asn)/glutamyl-tRNA(Gln) amidotransferase subunit C